MLSILKKKMILISYELSQIPETIKQREEICIFGLKGVENDIQIQDFDQGMEDDLVLKITKMIPYPWVNRMDRSLYIQHPQLDPVKLLRRTCIVTIAGYWIARIQGWNRPLIATASALPLILKFLFDEWKLKDLNPHGVIDFKSTPKLVLNSEQQVQSKSKVNIQTETISKRFKNIRKVPFLEQKIYSAKDFIQKLPADYCK